MQKRKWNGYALIRESKNKLVSASPNLDFLKIIEKTDEDYRVLKVEIIERKKKIKHKG